ncbi:DUF4168 domain-containing protein [Nodosilinea sp. E11]|uniref:DUF4168 domain-containing protein n=1 Tax=Nodosilinea sp. E11 TaxID=3037479 RepID=UPI0029350BD9|nr:DUF4168 domain-containing protein [Nodosilinea sp. E11]WOD40526.1 DUF4168 domain-containing protein [Nodosilinea sp. E11]
MIHRLINVLPLSNRTLALAAVVASLTVLAGGAGVPSPVAEGVTLGAVAQAQDSGISPEEVMGYAASVLEMDSPRNEAFSQIKTLLTGTSHDINAIDMSCTGTANLNQLPRALRNNVRTIVVNYCNQASTIVQANGLTVRRFNAITAAHPQDPSLAEQIRTAMVQIQQSQGSSRSVNGDTN